jgi:A/G-specific adenine glycosylase
LEFSHYTDPLLRWYSYYKRELPWRQTKDPYKIWLSEIILQQTRVLQGWPYYEKFIEVFPTIFDLARADEEEVLRTWQGLGYYSRARNLYKCARILAREFDGTFPESFEALKNLPGIGPYTAAAIASISFNAKTPVLDGNVFRVLSRLFNVNRDISTSSGKKYFSKLAMAMMPDHDPGEFNQAIMEFGALQCLPKNPACESCVLSTRCASYSKKNQHERPVKKRRQNKHIRYFNYLVIEKDSCIYLNKRSNNDIWKGLFDFYLYESKTKLTNLEHFAFNVSFLNHNDLNILSIREYKHVLTHQVIYAFFYHISLNHIAFNLDPLLSNDGKLYNKEDIHKLPKPVLIDKYLKEEIF